MYIQSNHLYEVDFGGIIIPKSTYTEHEQKYGRRSYIEVDENQLETLKQDKIFQALVNKKDYVISEKLPSGLMSFEDKAKLREATLTKVINDKDQIITELQKENASLKKQLTPKKEKVAK
jgi:hypothetical protein